MEAGCVSAAMMEPCGLLHLAAAVGARGDVDLEHAAEKLGPRDTVLSAAAVGGLVCQLGVGQLVVGLGQLGGSGYDAVSVGGGRCEDTMVADEVDAWRRHEGGELFDQLGGAEQERASTVWHHLTMPLLCTVRRIKPR